MNGLLNNLNGGRYAKETIKYLLRSKWTIRKYIREVEELYSMDARTLRERNSKRFVSLFRKAYDRSPFYRQLYMEAGIRRDDIQGIEDIEKLPIVTKEMIRHRTEEVRTTSRGGLVTNHTSGTTGTPLTVYEDWPALWREQAYFVAYRRRCGYEYGQPIVSLRGNLGKKDTYLKVHVSNTLYLSSYNINESTIRTYYEQIIRHKPIAIEGYPSSLYALSLQLRDANLTLSIPVAFTSSETLLDSQRALIERQLGTQIYDHYGTTERTIRLSELPDHSGYYEDPGYSINEYREDGVITTSLINESFPLIRYKVDDIIETEEGTDGKVKVTGIKGRSEDFVVCKDGTHVMRLGFIMKRTHNIKASQLVQRRPGHLLMKIVPDKEYSKADEEAVMKSLDERVGKGNMDITIEMTTMDGLEYSKSGKFKYIINDIGKT